VPSSERRGHTVLLLEDDPELALATKMLLGSVGFSMSAEKSAEDARISFEGKFPDVLITDIGLTGEDGLSFLRWASARAQEQGRRLFTIVVSGHPEHRNGRSAIEAGADRFYAKPFDPAELVNEVVTATGTSPIGPHLTQAFVDGTRIKTVLRHLER